MISDACNEFFELRGNSHKNIFPSSIHELTQKHVAMLFMFGELEGREI